MKSGVCRAINDDPRLYGLRVNGAISQMDACTEGRCLEDRPH
jgi:hypothetical protein